MKPTELQFKEFRVKASEWALQRLNDSDTVILDLETTGLLDKDPDTEICQISIINMIGKPVFGMMVQSAKPPGKEAANIHGITMDQLKDQPTFKEIAPLLSKILKGKHIVCYNSGFDVKLLWHMYRKYNLDVPKVAQVSCAMEKYSEFKGEWNEKKGGLKWHKLPKLAAGEAHDSLVDCASTLKLIKLIAGNRSLEEVEVDEISLDF